MFFLFLGVFVLGVFSFLVFGFFWGGSKNTTFPGFGVSSLFWRRVISSKSEVKMHSCGSRGARGIAHPHPLPFLPFGLGVY